MTYQKELAYHLRDRGYGEGEIAEIIRDVLAFGGSDAELAREFGEPAEYAGRFDKRSEPPQVRKSRRSRGVRLMIAAAVLSVAWCAFTLLGPALFSIDVRDIVGPIVLWPALAIIVAGILAGFLIDYLRPAPARKRSETP